jgi:ribosome-binding factor A
MTKRATRVADLLQKEISSIILTELQDPRIGFVTVTDVSVSDDLRYAKVYISVLGTADELEQSFQGLNSARGYIQNCIGRSMTLRYTPEISFHSDTSASYFSRIDKLLRHINSSSSDSPLEET